MMKLKAFAPASIGNFCVGFDLLGAAIKPIDGSLLGDIIEISRHGSGKLESTGRYSHQLPASMSDNIIVDCLNLFNQALVEKNMFQQNLHITLHKNLPVGSGLGSSSSSIVAMFSALNFWYSSPFSQTEIYQMMGQMEAQISGSLHYDNIAPCYLGGLQLMNQDNQLSNPLPWYSDWYIVIAYSGITVNTKAMREILPQSMSLSNAANYALNLSNFVNSLYCNNKQMTLDFFKDVVAEPYRENLLPDYLNHKSALAELGVKATSISGSGPTLFSICDSIEVAQQAEHYLKEFYTHNHEAFTHICQLDWQGSRIIEGN